MDYYKHSVEEALHSLSTSERGLFDAEAAARLQRYGANAIEEKKNASPVMIFLRQFNSPLVWILMAAVAISIFLGESMDSIVIGIILILNAVVGFVQEYKAERSIEMLKKMASHKALVVRDGVEKEIDSTLLVPGDIILLRTGEKVSADARLIEIMNLQVQESILTGESVPVKKELQAYDQDKEIADRKNMVYSGTIITNGKAKAVVTETGMKTQIGNIAHMLETAVSEPTPLQKRMAGLGRWLGMMTLALCAVLFMIGMIKGEPLVGFFLIVMSLAVAAIPEGLPAVVTIALAIGIKRMVKRNALIRKLSSVETLGSTTVICTDKTGTLTYNQMTVRKIYVDEAVIEVSGEGYEPKGTFSQNTKSLQLLLRIGAMNNDSKLEFRDEGYDVIGDPTEGALVVSAAKLGLDKDMLDSKHGRIDEIQFDSERKRMTTVHEMHGSRLSYVKGAPDVIIKLCSHIEIDGHVRRMTGHDANKVLKMNEYFAGQALRVLGFAYRKLGKNDGRKEYERNLVFVGLQGMIDPPRKEAKDSIAKCVKAGIRVVMITGDFKSTAVAIAGELGIKGRAVSGDELEGLDFNKDVDEIGVYARVNPEHKLRIIEALKRKGHVVAMTGDGINDAPALKKADIGVAMGIAGTDVTKEASDMILLDDNFTSIVNAVEEGRGVYENIKKFFAFMLAGNIGEVLIISIAVISGMPLPLTAIQILLINLVTDGLPAVALSADPFEPNAMERKPRPKDEPIYGGLGFVVPYIAVMAAVALGLFYYTHKSTGSIQQAQTVTFLAITAFEMYLAFAVRSLRTSSFKAGIFRNRFLLLAVALSVAVSVGVTYVPLFQRIFSMEALSWPYLMIAFLAPLPAFIYLEAYKAARGSGAA